MKFAIGDIVRLKSGGPAMTVAGFVNAQECGAEVKDVPWLVEVTWFDVSEARKTHFRAEVLELALRK